MIDHNHALLDQIISPNHLAQKFEAAIERLPDCFYDTFDYTSRGNNLTHPVTIGILTRVLGDMIPNNIVAHDIRFNEAARKFQPDLILLTWDLDPVIYIDYESPNSSDARIPQKDVKAYSNWVEDFHDGIPYFIITTLPNKSSPKWQLRHTGKKQYNAEFAGPMRQETTKLIRENPFHFWYRYYKSRINFPFEFPITFINIDGKRVEVVEFN